ncbi:Zinc finger protein [Dirofilaria immitis]
MCGLFILTLFLPAVFSLFTFGTTILLVHRIWTKERPLMKKAQDSAFRLYDQLFQSLVPKGLNDKFLKAEESKSRET